MARWVALSGPAPESGRPRDASPVERGTLMIELARPLAGPCALLDYRNDGDDRLRGLSVLCDPAQGIELMHRQGDRLVRHHFPGALPEPSGGLHIAFGWDAPGGRWTLSVAPRDGSRPPAGASGEGPMALPVADAAALCSGDETVTLHPSAEWCGVTRGAFPFPPPALVGASTLLDTPSGPAPARRLRAGDLVLTADEGPQPLISVTALELPHRGSLAPVRLRAGHFPMPRDLIVGPRQDILMEGAEVEYLFGAEEVFVAAQDLVDGALARRLHDGTATAMVALVLERPGVLLAEGVAFAAGHRDAEAQSARLCLRPYEAAAFRAARARG